MSSNVEAVRKKCGRKQCNVLSFRVLEFGVGSVDRATRLSAGLSVVVVVVVVGRIVSLVEC
jgi:hypothetical protein